MEPIELAERIAQLARELGIQTALIGAHALAVHRHVRASNDIDLATVVQLHDLKRLRAAVEALGLNALLTTPDEQDALGGVLKIWDRVDEDGDPLEPLDIVNFYNPYRPRRSPASDAIHGALPVPDHPELRCPKLADLIAMKLDAGGRHDLADVVQLLVHNPEADLDEIRKISATYGFEVIDQLIAEAEVLRSRSK